LSRLDALFFQLGLPHGVDPLEDGLSAGSSTGNTSPPVIADVDDLIGRVPSEMWIA
jgi:hypothetical protein